MNGPMAGIVKTTPETGDLPPSWDVCSASSDVDATAGQLTSAGGKALREPPDAAGARCLAALQDPRGALFEVISMALS